MTITRGREEEAMPEVYTCKCGGQAWTIYGTTIECRKCGMEYKLTVSAAFEFNMSRKNRTSSPGEERGGGDGD